MPTDIDKYDGPDPDFLIGSVLHVCTDDDVAPWDNPDYDWPEHVYDTTHEHPAYHVGPTIYFGTCDDGTKLYCTPDDYWRRRRHRHPSHVEHNYD